MLLHAFFGFQSPTEITYHILKFHNPISLNFSLNQCLFHAFPSRCVRHASGPSPVPLKMSLVACVNSCHAAKSGVYNFSVLHFMPHILLMLFGFLLLLLLLLLPLPPSSAHFFGSPLFLSRFREWNFKCLAADVFSFIRKSAFIFRLVHSKRLALMRSLVVFLSFCFFFSNLFFVIFPRSSTNYDNDNRHCAPAFCLCLAKTVRRILLLQGSFSHQFGKLPSSRANEPADAKTEIEPTAED